MHMNKSIFSSPLKKTSNIIKVVCFSATGCLLFFWMFKTHYANQKKKMKIIKVVLKLGCQSRVASSDLRSLFSSKFFIIFYKNVHIIFLNNVTKKSKIILKFVNKFL